MDQDQLRKMFMASKEKRGDRAGRKTDWRDQLPRSYNAEKAHKAELAKGINPVTGKPFVSQAELDRQARAAEASAKAVPANSVKEEVTAGTPADRAKARADMKRTAAMDRMHGRALEEHASRGGGGDNYNRDELGRFAPS